MKKARKKSATKKTFSAKQAVDLVKAGATRVTPKDLETAVRKADRIESKVKGVGPLSRFLADVKLLLAVIRDYWKGRYREIPFWTIAAIVVALLYVLNPFDIIPDVVPVFGYLDDVAVIAACLTLVRQDLIKYEIWRVGRKKTGSR
jgi:uncharacterized membrane protein YkvA (DUF1232 family)